MKWLSDIGLLYSGVLQGFVLGSMVLLFCVNDITKGLEIAGFVFVNDIRLFGTANSEDIHRVANKNYQWSARSNLRLNLDKYQRFI